MRLIFLFLGVQTLLNAQHISDFVSVLPTAQTPNLVIPSTHVFQVLIQEGDTLSNGGILPPNPDFTAYVPTRRSSREGRISLNHENTVGGATILDVSRNPNTGFWQIQHSEAVNFAPVFGTARNCSGGITPWNTVLSGEEVMNTYDGNSDGYADNGWLTEIDPISRVALRKLWKVGRASHENAAVSFDRTTLYTGGDDPTFGFLFKFETATPGDFTDGRLYVLKLTAGGAGIWMPLPNTTQADCNNACFNAQALGATNIAGIEDVEIAPNGKIYLAAKHSGQVYRFNDMGETVENYEIFVATTAYPITHSGGTVIESWGTGNDNLAFDDLGNLWVLQDGGNNHIWVISPTHTAANPQVRLFATTPAGSEPTGITFSPNYKFIFLSIQHPFTWNSTPQTDATGRSILFNRSTTLVISRSAVLGQSFCTCEPD